MQPFRTNKSNQCVIPSEDKFSSFSTGKFKQKPIICPRQVSSNFRPINNRFNDAIVMSVFDRLRTTQRITRPEILNNITILFKTRVLNPELEAESKMTKLMLIATLTHNNVFRNYLPAERKHIQLDDDIQE